MRKLIFVIGATLTAGAAMAQLTIVNTIAGTFTDISGTGTALNLADDAEVDINTTVGNSLFAAGIARVGSNGGVRFAGPGTDLSFTNAALPAAGNFGLTSQVLDSFWDDINTVGGTVGNIYWQEIGNVLFVQWQNAGFFGGTSNDVATFQLQVHGSGSPALAQFLYTDIEGTRAGGGSSATIGYQGGGIQNDVQWSFNTASVSNGTVLSLVVVPEPGTYVAIASGLGLLLLRRKRN